jgi:hypothetical protein
MEVLKSHNKPVMDIAWGPNKYFFLSASRDGYAKVKIISNFYHLVVRCEDTGTFENFQPTKTIKLL